MALISWGKKVNGNGHDKPVVDIEDSPAELKKQIAYLKYKADMLEQKYESMSNLNDELKEEIQRLNDVIMKNMEFLHSTFEKLVLAKIPQGESPKAALSPSLQAYLEKKKAEPVKKLP